MRTNIALMTGLLLAGLCLHPFSVTAEVDGSATDPKLQQRIAFRSLLEEGHKSGKLPDGVVIRVSADLFLVDEKVLKDAKARGEELEESLEETWEFTSREVYRVEIEYDEKGKRIYRRIESRPFNSKNLYKQLLDGKLLEIGTGKGTGKPVRNVGTHFLLGGRSVEVLRTGEAEPLILLGEHCTGAGYPESDATAFAALYEKLAGHAHAAFKTKAAEPK